MWLSGSQIVVRLRRQACHGANQGYCDCLNQDLSLNIDSARLAGQRACLCPALVDITEAQMRSVILKFLWVSAGALNDVTVLPRNRSAH